MKCLLVLAALVAFVHAYPKCEGETRDYVKKITHNFCQIPKNKIQEYSTCSDKAQYFFSRAGPACAMSCSDKKDITLDDIYEMACEKGREGDGFKEDVIQKICCDTIIQMLYKGDDTLKGKHDSNRKCAEEVGGKDLI